MQPACAARPDESNGSKIERKREEPNETLPVTLWGEPIPLLGMLEPECQTGGLRGGGG
jgi:hypothetical protein